MRETLLHTPEGVRDIYGNECEKKIALVNSIHHVLHLYGYHDIETPSFEFFDIFNYDKGSAPSNEMYKFFDRNNNTLVLRPDITPSIARCAAKYYADEELPIRLCYSGRTYINAPLHQGKLNQISQIGCELINDDSSAADAEIITSIVDCLKVSGLKEFQLEVGDVDFFKGLMEEGNVSDEIEETIRDFIQIKNFFGLSEYVENLDISDNLKKCLSEFDTLFGGVEVLDKAASYTKNERALEAIDRLRKVYKAISYYGYEKYIDFDFSTLNGYDYYTGIVFSGYTYGTGDAIVKGGRYNNLLPQFGKDAPSIGFAVVIDELLMALSRQHLDKEIERDITLILYNIDDQENAIKFAESLRNKDRRTELIRKSKRHDFDEYKAYAKKNEVEKIYYFLGGESVVVYNTANDEEKTIMISDLKEEI